MYLLPTVAFTVSGGDPGPFLTAARDYGIAVRRFSRKNGLCRGEVPAFRYRKAARLARTHGLRLRVCQRKGLYFRLYRYRRRLGLLAGIVLFLGALLFSQSFLWAVDVTPTASVTEQQVLDVLKSHGIRVGTYLPSADLKTAALLSRVELPGLAFFALNRVGSRIQVEMADATPQPPRPLSSGEGVCNIVAARTGLIRSLEPYRGQTMVRVNQSVHQGDLLVSGVVENADGRTSYQHAAARIMAETRWEKSFSLQLRQTTTQETGQVRIRYSLDLFGKKLPLFLAFPAFQPKEPYESRTALFEPRLGSVQIPLGVEREELRFVRQEQTTFTEEEALTALQNAAHLYEETLPGEILTQESSAAVSNGRMTLTVVYTVLEDIAQESPFFYPETS